MKRNKVSSADERNFHVELGLAKVDSEMVVDKCNKYGLTISPGQISG